jgi:hypothetical protein
MKDAISDFSVLVTSSDGARFAWVSSLAGYFGNMTSGEMARFRIGELITTCPWHICAPQFSMGGHQLLTASGDGYIYVLNTEAARFKQLTCFPYVNNIDWRSMFKSAVFSPARDDRAFALLRPSRAFNFSLSSEHPSMMRGGRRVTGEDG